MVLGSNVFVTALPNAFRRAIITTPDYILYSVDIIGPPLFSLLCIQ